MNAAQYRDEFEKIWKHMIGIPAGRSVTGNGYMLGQFGDGSAVAVVNGKILEISVEPITDHAFEVMEWAARKVAIMPIADRAAYIAKNHPGEDRVIISGVIWSKDGEYLGLNWN